MSRYLRYILPTVLVFVVLVAGCDDRGRNVPTVTVPSDYGTDPTDHVFFTFGGDPQLLMQISNPAALLSLDTYIPQISLTPANGGENRPVPTLILLAPEGETEYYYLEHGLYELAHEMIENGEIQPMTIVCVGNDQVFGGYFYGSSYPAGFYDQVLGDEMIDYLEMRYPETFINDKAKIGIGGIGQGAYGAFRAAIKSELYGSISVVDGPLDFDGATGTGGLIPLMDQVFVEQSTLTAANWRSAPPAGMDSLRSYPISRMFIGGALAFTPHDTGLTYTVTLDTTTSGGVISVEANVNVTEQRQIADTVSLMRFIVGSADNLTGITWYFHLPFSFTQRPYQPIWDLWMDNDLEALHAAQGGSPLADVNMWIGTSTQAKWGYHDMTMSWIATLQNAGYAPETYTYGGYEGYPAENGEFMYDLLRKMLIFHSESFGD